MKMVLDLQNGFVTFSKKRNWHYEYTGNIMKHCLSKLCPKYELNRLNFITAACTYILLKRSLESVVHISLYNRLQTHADSERINRSSYNFQRMFPTLPSSISVETNSFGVTQL